MYSVCVARRGKDMFRMLNITLEAPATTNFVKLMSGFCLFAKLSIVSNARTAAYKYT